MIELLGWAANVLFFAGGVFKNPRLTAAFYVLANALFVVMYASIGIALAAITMGITTLRNLLAIVLNDKHNKISVVILTAITIAILLFTLKNTGDIIILMAAIAIAASYYYIENFILFRLFSSLSQVLWITHSIMFDIYSMMCCCIIILTTNIGALIIYTGLKDAILMRLGFAQPSAPVVVPEPENINSY
jgi:hypothetical protein